MGINNVTFQALRAAMNLVQTEKPQVLSLGYPDILVDREHWPEDVEIRADSHDVCRYHGREFDEIPESYDFLRKLGWELTVTDFKELRGESQLGQFFPTDLNDYSVENGREGRFDLVIDCGTMEHIMNLVSCIVFINRMCKVGGYIFHANPMQQQNHGFWSFSPTFYNDLYVPVNGCEVVAQVALSTDDQETVVNVPQTGRFRIEGEWNILTLVKKLADAQICAQIQTKYKKMLA